MPDGERQTALENLLEAAFREALRKFASDVEHGEIDPLRQRDGFRRRRRDYSSWLRMQEVPDEARTLAAQLLQAHQIRLDDAARETFEFDVTRLLIRLYDAFIETAGNGDQGSR